MINLAYVMTYWERIEGPLPSTAGSPFQERFCWKIVEGTLKGRDIEAKLAMPGTDWMRVGSDGIRRADTRVQFVTGNGETVLMSYNTGIIRDEGFLEVLKSGKPSDFGDQYMRMVPVFETGSKALSWLHGYLFIGEGRLAGDKEIEYRIYRV